MIKHFLTTLEGKIIFSGEQVEDLNLKRDGEEIREGYYIISVEKNSPLSLNYFKFAKKQQIIILNFVSWVVG